MVKRAFVLTVILSGIASCGDGNTPPDDGFDRKALLRNLAGAVIEPAIVDASVQLTALSTTAAAFSIAIEADQDASARPIHAAWENAMEAWQHVEVFQVGPAGRGLNIAGSAGLRDEIYSWPSTIACRIDQEIVEEAYGNPGFFDAELSNVYGLDAMERLLFVRGEESACAASAPIITDGSWAAVTNKNVRRARYAKAIADYSAAKATELADAWATGSEFRTAYENGTSPYTSVRDAVDQTFGAMFYIDRQLKDQKLATPLGISADCTEMLCLDTAESGTADISLRNVQANLQAFEALFTGGSDGAQGFDDFLIARGAPELAQNMSAAITAAREAADRGESLMDAANSDLDGTRSIHTHVKTMSDLLKSQFITVLGLTGPGEGAADND